jgi:hypothetical protein
VADGGPMARHVGPCGSYVGAPMARHGGTGSGCAGAPTTRHDGVGKLEGGTVSRTAA